MKGINLFITAFIMLIITPDLSGQDWTQFRGTERNGKVTGFKAPAAWPAELKQIWKINVGPCDATPVLAGGKIYLHTRQGNEEVVTCLDAVTGKEIWRYGYAAPAVTGPATSHPGPRSTPVMADGKIITLGVAGTLSCLDASTGKLLWQKGDTLFPDTQFFTGMSPVVVDGICIVQQGGKENGFVVAYNLKTGDEKWRYSGEGPAYGSPSVMAIDKAKQLVLVTEKSLLGLNCADGKLLWKTDATCQQRFYNASSPVIDGGKIYISGAGTGTKAISIIKKGNQFTVKELWNNPEVGAKWNTAILKDGFLYGFSDQKRIYCLDVSTGKSAWTDNTVNSDFATIVDCGPVIIGLPSTGNLIVLKPDSKAYTEIKKYKVAETPVYSFPVIAGNVIYVKDAESLMMYRIE